MFDFETLKDSIELDGETVFYHHIAQNMEKASIYNQALKEGKISNFDPVILSRLRKLFYAFYSGLIYMYSMPTDLGNIGDKADLFSHVLMDKDYKMVRGKTDSIREIPFFMYKGQQHLDIDIWFEVQEGQKTWVYDLFSMLKIEKGVFEKLEHPEVDKVFTKEKIMSHPAWRDGEYSMYSNAFDFMMIGFFEDMQKNMKQFLVLYQLYLQQ